LNSVPLKGTTTPSGAVRLRVAASSAQPRTPQHALDPGEQLARAEGLGEIVVGAHLQSDDAVGLLAARGEHDDRHVRAAAQVAAQLQPVGARQHQVEDDQVGTRGLERAAHGLAVRRGGDAVALLVQILAQEAARLGVVVDDQDVVLHGDSRHLPPSGALSAGKL
jgi:hypothetical protein